MKLWQKQIDKNTSEKVEKFTVGNDKDFDILLAEFDVMGSMAHANMLESINIITKEENKLIQAELNNILSDIKKGNFKIDDGIEDIHSQIEFLLTNRIGESGKKIHSGRSRNDQVLLDLKLYLRQEAKDISQHIFSLFQLLIELSEKNKNHLLPGYTHLQIAMPSSFGLWFGAYAESLTDDMEMLVAAFNVINKNPLGSAAGYGTSFPLNREMTTKELNFKSMNYNVVYAQMTRGKTEKILAMAMATIAATLSKLAYDACLYLNQNFGFISFPDDLTTGSSIMPHKKNPDVFELIRAKCNKIQALPNELTLLTNNLPSGYHRDMQLTKEILFPQIQELKNCLSMTEYMLQHIEVKKNILDDEKYKYLFSVEAVNAQVLRGMSFREAYKKVGLQIESGKFDSSTEINHTHEGSIGNLCNDKISRLMNQLMNQIN